MKIIEIILSLLCCLRESNFCRGSIRVSEGSGVNFACKEYTGVEHIGSEQVRDRHRRHHYCRDPE